MLTCSSIGLYVILKNKVKCKCHNITRNSFPLYSCPFCVHGWRLHSPPPNGWRVNTLRGSCSTASAPLPFSALLFHVCTLTSVFLQSEYFRGKTLQHSFLFEFIDCQSSAQMEPAILLQLLSALLSLTFHVSVSFVH